MQLYALGSHVRYIETGLVVRVKNYNPTTFAYLCEWGTETGPLQQWFPEASIEAITPVSPQGSSGTAPPHQPAGTPPPPEPLSFKSGDVVILRSGGPRMTIDEVRGDDVSMLGCVWFGADGCIETKYFRAIVLSPAPPLQPRPPSRDPAQAAPMRPRGY